MSVTFHRWRHSTEQNLWDVPTAVWPATAPILLGSETMLASRQPRIKLPCYRTVGPKRGGAGGPRGVARQVTAAEAFSSPSEVAHILLVDDERALLASTSRLLRHQGYA